MRCRLAEARVSWGKGEADVALRAARAVATRLRASGGGGGGGVAESPDDRSRGGGVEGRAGEREEQFLLSEVGWARTYCCLPQVIWPLTCLRWG